MGSKLWAICILLCLLLPFPAGFSQEEEPAWGDQSSTVPDLLRRPDRGEALRYPRDMVIGELGQGESPDGAYLFARELLSILTLGYKEAEIIRDSPSLLTESLLEEIDSIGPRNYRIGGGRIEADGSVSFIVRFIGSEESITGELYIRQEGNPVIQSEDEIAYTNVPGGEKWLLDDLVLEEKRALTEIKDSYRYDFSPYERFY